MNLQRYEESKQYLDLAEKLVHKFPTSRALIIFSDTSIKYYYSQQQFNKAEEICGEALRRKVGHPEFQKYFEEILENLRNASQ